MINRRTFLSGAAVAGALAGVGALAGCAPRNQPGVVKYWGSGGDLGRLDDKVIKAFNETDQGKDITIAKSAVPSNGTGDATSIITAVRGGTAPDVWVMDRFSAAQYASLGLLEPLESMIEKAGDDVDDIRKQYIDFAVTEMTYQGKLYGIPTDCDTRVMYYNKALVREAGIDLDELDPYTNPDPLTVDRVREMADSMTKKDGSGAYTQLGFIPWDGEGWGYGWALGNGAKFFDNGDCAITIDTKEALGAYEYLYDEARRLVFSKVDAFKATYEPPNHPPAQTSFLSGKQGFQIGAPSGQYSMRKYVPKLEFGVARLPVLKEGQKPYTWSGGFALVCPKGSSLSRETWEFMKFFAGAPGQSIYMPAAYTLPTNLEVLDKSTSPVLTKDLKFFIEQFPYSTSRPPFPVSGLWWDSMATAQSSVTLGSKTAKGALEVAQARVAPQMQLYCPFKMPAGYGTIGA